MNKIRRYGRTTSLFIASIILLFSVKVLFAENNHGHETEPATGKTEKFNAGKLIMEHIADAHDWHLFGHVAIPLPVILYSDRGLDMFLSSKFEHGHATYHGKYDYRLNHGKIEVVDADNKVDEAVTAKLYDVSITKNVFSIFMTMALMAWMFIAAANMYKRNPGQAPKGIQSFVEPLIIFVRDEIAIASIGEKKHAKYLPFLLTVFFFIWISNLLGLVPVIGGANVTGNIAVAMTLAAIVFIITLLTANANYWRHIFAMPGVPVGVLVLLTPIEILGVFLRPFVLMIRLFANILAGHIIALSFFSLIFIFAEFNAGLGYGVSILSIAFTVFMGMLELLVAFLQAYVFTLLSAMYFGTAIEEHHAEH